jgi:hypothetical protein
MTPSQLRHSRLGGNAARWWHMIAKGQAALLPAATGDGVQLVDERVQAWQRRKTSVVVKPGGKCTLRVGVVHARGTLAFTRGRSNKQTKERTPERTPTRAGRTNERARPSSVSLESRALFVSRGDWI